jgi:hypothetical protein
MSSYVSTLCVRPRLPVKRVEPNTAEAFETTPRCRAILKSTRPLRKPDRAAGACSLRLGNARARRSLHVSSKPGISRTQWSELGPRIRDRFHCSRPLPEEPWGVFDYVGPTSRGKANAHLIHRSTQPETAPPCCFRQGVTVTGGSVSRPPRVPRPQFEPHRVTDGHTSVRGRGRDPHSIRTHGCADSAGSWRDTPHGSGCLF